MSYEYLIIFGLFLALAFRLLLEFIILMKE